MLRERLTDGVKLRIRKVLAKAGIEIGAYAGSFAQHRTRIILGGGVKTVWDVGAHIGQYAAQLQSHRYVGRIISIEANDVSFEKLAERAGGSARWTTIAVAIADSVGESVLNVAANGQSSSLLPMAQRHRSASPSSRYVGSQPVKTTTLDALQAQLRPALPFFLKLDLQGSELAALQGAPSVLGSAVACEIELSFTELYEGGASWLTVVNYLVAAGFHICDVERVFFDDASGDLLQVNALFRRPT